MDFFIANYANVAPLITYLILMDLINELIDLNSF